MIPRAIRIITAPALIMTFSGCASLRTAVVGDLPASLAESATLSFAREGDLQLAAEAMPFALKTLDMMALQQPRNEAVLLAAAQAYILYSHAFLDWEARKIEDDDLARAEHLRQRATALHRRGRDYAAAALAIHHPDPLTRLLDQPVSFLAGLKPSDAPALLWLGVGWASVIAANPSDMNEVARLPLVENIMRRAYELDPDAGQGALHEFFLAYEGGRSPAMGGDPERARFYFDRAVAASGGLSASPYVTLATTVAIQQQDAALFRDLLQQALDLDLDAAPDRRLANALAQDKARWYLDHIDRFILTAEPETP